MNKHRFQLFKYIHCTSIQGIMYCSAHDKFSGVAILKGKHGLLKLLIKDNVSLIAENDCALRFLLRKAGVDPCLNKF